MISIYFVIYFSVFCFFFLNLNIYIHIHINIRIHTHTYIHIHTDRYIHIYMHIYQNQRISPQWISQPAGAEEKYPFTPNSLADHRDVYKGFS